ncbi:MAG: transglycosylase domain-containing protein [Bdellovibrionales bacterium]
MKKRFQILILGISALTLAVVVGLGLTVAHLQSKISSRLEKGWVLAPLELFSQGMALAPGRRFPLEQVRAELERKGLQPDRDFVLGSVDACTQRTGISPVQVQVTEEKENEKEEERGGEQEIQACLWLKSPQLMVFWDHAGWIQSVWAGAPLAPVGAFSLFPSLITQFFDAQPILQQNTALGEIPLACLQAVTAIEDRDFLQHPGVSATGILRAVIRNLKAGRWAEGGSTITQQLVKNFFLTSKKTLRRKLEEQILAILLESQLNKDQILEMYLNVIYMGQSGPYQVRGFGSASEHYFSKPISSLNLSECALLAALINSPGRYSPFGKAEAARLRRELVLKKMQESGMVSASEMETAATQPLPDSRPRERLAHAPYFVASALKEFESWELDAEEGARLYTSLDPEAQSRTVNAIQKILASVEGRIKKPSQDPLQVAALVVDIPTAKILALVGGRNFRTTQYNRATDSRRQIGSVVKPFVYWPALEGEKNPLTAVNDQPFEWTFGRQRWRPKNYDGQARGPVPYFYALANSLNIPAARVGQEVGLDAVAKVLRDAGVTVDIPRLPSLTLGALELSPLEVAKAFLTLARFGRSGHPHTLERVETPSGELLFQTQDSNQTALDPVTTAVLVGMMKQSFEIGTARAARAWGLAGPYAGKTGTTSDSKDAWFVGFNNRLLTVVWVGYDDNTAMGLTGSSAALPVWVEINKSLQEIYKPGDFDWPDGVEVRTLTRDELIYDFPEVTDLPDQFELVFTSWAN